MNILGRFVEGGLLLGLAAFILKLLDSGLYYQFLNPKFKPLSAATAVALALMGLARLAQRDRPARLFRVLCLGFFLVLALFALDTVAPPPLPASFGAGDPFDDPGSSGGFGSNRVSLAKPSRLDRDGFQYVRLNIAELALLGLRVAANEVPMPPRVTLTGVVRRTPELDAQNQFLVSRLIVTCCLADATAAAVLVQAPARPEVREGQWVRIYGRPVPRTPEGQGSDGQNATDRNASSQVLNLPGVSSVLIDEHSRIEAEAVEPMAEPELPFIFDIRDKEPFAG